MKRRSDSECFKQTSLGTLSKLVLDNPKIIQKLFKLPSYLSEDGVKALSSPSPQHLAPSTIIPILSCFPARCSPDPKLLNLIEVEEAQLAEDSRLLVPPFPHKKLCSVQSRRRIRCQKDLQIFGESNTFHIKTQFNIPRMTVCVLGHPAQQCPGCRHGGHQEARQAQRGQRHAGCPGRPGGGCH